MVPLGYVTADPGRRTTDTIERVVESSGSRRSGRGGSRTRKAPGTARGGRAALQAVPVSGRVALPYPQFQWSMQGPNLGGTPGVAPACHAGAWPAELSTRTIQCLDQDSIPDSSLGARRDHPFHHRGNKRKARDSNPYPSFKGTALAERLGKPYPTTFRFRVDRRGVEPRFPVCKAGVVPLDQQPVVENELEVSRTFTRGPPENRSRSPPYQGGMLPEHLQTGRLNCPGKTRTCAKLCVREASWPPDDGTIAVSSTGGSRTHRIAGFEPGRFASSRAVPSLYSTASGGI